MAIHKFLFIHPVSGSPISIGTTSGAIRGVSGDVLEFTDDQLKIPLVAELIEAGDSGAQDIVRLERVVPAPTKSAPVPVSEAQDKVKKK